MFLTILSYALWSMMVLFGIKLIFWDAPKYFEKYWHGVLCASLGIGLIIFLCGIWPWPES